MKFKIGDKIKLDTGELGKVVGIYDTDKYVARCEGIDYCVTENEFKLQANIDWQYVIDGGFDCFFGNEKASRKLKEFDSDGFMNDYGRWSSECTIRQEVGHIQPHFGGDMPAHVNPGDMVICYFKSGITSSVSPSGIINWPNVTKFIVAEKSND